MKSLLILAGITACLSSSAEPYVQSNERLAIVGDSITEQRLYSTYIETYLRACAPQLGSQTIQLGWGGETAPGFFCRMEWDLMAWKPTLATICYGMNDGYYRAANEETTRWYREGMDRILARLAKDGARAIVGTPGVVDSDNWNPADPSADQTYNETLRLLGEEGRKLAATYKFPVAEVHDVMMNVMAETKKAYGNTYPLAGRDGVHPAPNGHLCMAYAFLKAMGLDGNLATFSVTWPKQVQASTGHTASMTADGVVAIESTRYPFCFTGAENDPNGMVSVLPFLPFNADLNRFILVVKDLPSPRASVTWGKTTRDFSREQLAAGINLAAEFLDNPFSEPFARVLESVSSKEEKEHHLIKGFMHNLLSVDLLGDDPEAKAAVEVVRQHILKRLDQAQGTVQSVVVPVKHTLTIIPKS